MVKQSFNGKVNFVNKPTNFFKPIKIQNVGQSNFLKSNRQSNKPVSFFKMKIVNKQIANKISNKRNMTLGLHSIKIKNNQKIFKPIILPNKINIKKVSKKELTYPQAIIRYKKLTAFGDADRDGKLNMFDCKPFNKKKHGFAEDLVTGKDLSKYKEEIDSIKEEEKEGLSEQEEKLYDEIKDKAPTQLIYKKEQDIKYEDVVGYKKHRDRMEKLDKLKEKEDSELGEEEKEFVEKYEKPIEEDVYVKQGRRTFNLKGKKARSFLENAQETSEFERQKEKENKEIEDVINKVSELRYRKAINPSAEEVLNTDEKVYPSGKGYIKPSKYTFKKSLVTIDKITEPKIRGYNGSSLGKIRRPINNNQYAENDEDDYGAEDIKKMYKYGYDDIKDYLKARKEEIINQHKVKKIVTNN